MDLLWMILSVFLICAEAENVTEVKVKLGQQNVTLNCSALLQTSTGTWRSTVQITYGKTDNDPSYSFPEFKTKYSILENRLVITNVTAEDCRLYFCARMINDNIHYEDTIHLDSDVITLSTNEPSNQRTWPRELITFSSFTLNVLFVLIITGLLFSPLYLKRENSKHPGDAGDAGDATNTLLLLEQKTRFHQVEMGPDSVYTTCVYQHIDK